MNNVKQLFCLVCMAALYGTMLPCARAANPYIATGTFTASITSGTCTVTATDNSGAATSTIDMGDIYFSEIKNSSPVIPFKLKFSDCLGVSTITVSNAIGACTGASAQGDAFANTLTGEGNAAGVGLEIWMGGVGEGGLMHCHSPESNAQNVITLGTSPVITAQTVTQDMNARIVPAAEESAGMTAGMFNATVNFTLTYE
ncbi:fimbrial protein [Enterobacter roggenkampii]|uniref:fimbrial protein n=1 Tax=Enterobacter roggenkampii TaxID=1812935 RepID=UPI002FF6098A